MSKNCYYDFDLFGVPLDVALNVVASDPLRSSGAEAWRVDAEANRIIFYWHQNDGAIALPAVTEVAALKPLIESWLAGVKYPTAPNIDGSVERGWRIHNDIPGGEWYAIFAVEPVWLEYHK